MSNLLEKASIILTPTAYNNGEALCVKPSDGSGDFDFSRNSAATRVNAQGLVENVQILSSNLVQNGDFSEEGSEEVSNGSFSQEGAELVTNGDFEDGSTGWNLGGDIPIVEDGVLKFTLGGTYSRARQNIGVVNAKITYTVVNSNIPAFTIRDYGGGNSQVVQATVGTHTIYKNFIENGINITASGSVGDILEIDNFSVREVGQDWNLTDGCSIVEQGLRIVSDGTIQDAIQSNVVTNGKTYKVQYEIIEAVSGSLKITGTFGANLAINSTVGVHTFYATATDPNLNLRRNTSPTDITITNISVKEVGQNWDFGTGWSIGNSVAISDTTASNLTPSTTLISGEKYKFTLDVAKISAGSFTFLLRFNGTNTTFATINTEGSFTFYATADATGFRLQNLSGGTTDFSVTNITAVQITDDTNLPRINYEGFSYQDALGSEQIVNGGFDDGSANWTVAGGNPIFENSSVNLVNFSTINSNNTVVEQGKTYKITYTISNKVGNSSFGFFLGGWNVAQYQDVGTHSEIISVSSSSVIYIRNGNSNSSVTIDNVSVKEYLGQEVVPDSGCGSWLWEPQSTNLQKYSTTLSTNWIVTGSGVVTYNNAISPDGTNNATYFSAPASSSKALYNQLPISTSTYTASVWAKSKGLGNDKFQLGEGSGTGTGGVGEFTATSEWQRFTITGTTVSGSRPVGIFQPIDFSAMDILFWGYQYEEQSYATSYIPTNGEANGVTRNQDVCTNGGSLASINSTEGVLYAEIAKRQDNNDSYILISLNNQASNSDNNSVTIGFSNSTGFFLRIRASGNSYLLFQGSSVLANKNQFYKVALKYKSGNSSVFIDGVNVLNSTDIFSFNQSLDNLSFDFNGNGGYPFYGKTKALAVWKEALTDSELQSLTTI